MDIKFIASFYVLISINFILSLTAYRVKLHYYEVFAFSDRDRKLLYAQHIKEKNVAFLNGITNEAGIPIIVTTKTTDSNIFEQYLVNNSIQFTRFTIHRDIIPGGNNNSKFTNNFNEWPSVTEWVNNMAAQYSSILKKIVIGKTIQHRELFVLKISKENENMKRCAVFLLSGEQGRDWLTPAVTLHLVKQLLQNNKLLTKFTDFYDFYFMPFFNPDGYQYSLTTDMMWAKNRKDFSPYKSCNDDGLIGVNVDRNWLERSATACTAVNLGLDALSEQETASLAAFLSGIAPKTLAFINVRTFMRLVTIPSSNNFDVLLEILAAALSNLEEKHNIAYPFGNKDKLLYNFSSCAADWVKHKLNIPLVYTVYMQNEDNFLPKESDIEPMTTELTILTDHILDIAKEIYRPLINRHQNIKLCPCVIFSVTIMKFIIN